MKVFDSYARYYDLLYRDKDYKAEAKFIHQLLQQYAPETQSILELGCGTGNHAILLAQLGYQYIQGIDLSLEMLSRAAKQLIDLSQENGSKLHFKQGDVRTFRTDQKFDSVISLFHVMSYLTTAQDLEAAFKTAKAHLKPGGLFIFDCWYGPTVLSDPPTSRIKRLETEEIRVTRIAEPVMYANQDQVEVNYQIFIQDKTKNTIEELRETHTMRYLFKHEIDYLFDRVGFQLLDYAEWMTNKPAGFDTWGVYFVGRA
jgi:SAM-dependent methyltransferase